jgi:phospholipase C
MSQAAGTIMDVEHIVILMQENRSFDHYFGTLHGVRGFGDRFPIPVAGQPNVWFQRNDNDASVVSPFHLNTQQSFDLMRVTGTPHTWPNAQGAWSNGKLDAWPTYKQNHAMGYYSEADLPFQFALANMFTICDAYHCSLQAGTNPNRVYAWSGNIDPFQQGHGPVIGNSYEHLAHDPDGGYAWTTYPERLQAAGISWQVYQDMEDNYTDNPLAGFRTFRDAAAGLLHANPQLLERGLSTRTLDQLKSDVLANRLPQVSYIVATAEGSEHPVPSSPAQGAAYTAAVIAALTANPEVWSKTVLFLMFDENDGFFDHMPPPAVPSYSHWHGDPRLAVLAGASTVSTAGEYHEFASTENTESAALMHRPYGLGPRVPMYVISPWSRGGWVNSQVFDHTSVIRFMEQRFGVMEPNITPWRRAVCGDLTSAFDFTRPDPAPFLHALPDTGALAERARELDATTLPSVPMAPAQPMQARGTRPSRALPYDLHVSERIEDGRIELTFTNSGQAGAVFHVYDNGRLHQLPRRYTVEPHKELRASWVPQQPDGAYDLWVLGPNGFHRHLAGLTDGAVPLRVMLEHDPAGATLSVRLRNAGAAQQVVTLSANAYLVTPARTVVVPAGATIEHPWPLAETANWYDVSVRAEQLPQFLRRFAGRIETGRDGISDPAMGMPAAWPYNVSSGEAIGKIDSQSFHALEESMVGSVSNLL